MRRPFAAAGFTLIEMLITLVVLGMLFMIGLPSLATWMQNTQVRNSAESLIGALQIARNEAVRRNRTVQFSLTDTLGATCVTSATGTEWVVSVSDPEGFCDQTPTSSAAGVQIIQKGSSLEGSQSSRVTSNMSTVVFNGIGRLSVLGPGNTTPTINVTHATQTCQTASGPIRCLRVTVSASGSVRMCDPQVTDSADPRSC
jgi:type IV fimbrial biogenesis protein FimT